MSRWWIVIAALLGFVIAWGYQERRELVMRVMLATSAGEPPPLGAITAENPEARWVDDYFTVELVAPRTFAIGEPRYAQQNYSYLVIGAERALLFDAGPGLRDIRGVAESLTDRPILFLPSHFHYDHVGNEVTFEEVAVVDLPYLRERAQGDRLRLTTMEHLGGAEGFEAPTLQVDHWWKPGTRVELGGRALWLLYTPGHTTDSVSLWDRENAMVFSGDYLYPGELYGFLPNSSMGDYDRTATALLRELPEGTAFFGAHRVEPPGPPRLGWQDLVDLKAGLDGIRERRIAGRGRYPQAFAVSERLTMLAEPRWMQRWE
jgi:glyoxylase-like metal-dependent hydrolase (beta-lactamase superfamily II)